MAADVPVYNRTGTNTWATPRGFLSGLLSPAGLDLGPVTLDLAAERDTALAALWYGPDHPDERQRDALGPGAYWDAAEGTRWLNPPYGRTCLTCPGGVWTADGPEAKRCARLGHRSRTVNAWLRRCAEETRRPSKNPLIVLLPVRADGWWHRYVIDVATEVLYVHGRLGFLQPSPRGDGLVPAPAKAPFASMIVRYDYSPDGRQTRIGRLSTSGHRIRRTP